MPLRFPSVCQILTVWRKQKSNIILVSGLTLGYLVWYVVNDSLSKQFAELEEDKIKTNRILDKTLEAQKEQEKRERETKYLH